MKPSEMHLSNAAKRKSEDETASKKPKSNKKIALEGLLAKNILIVDARESGEPESYVVKVTNRTPKHMQRRLLLNTKFEHIYPGDDAEGLNGLVDLDHDNADERAEEVWQWLDSQTTVENKMHFPFNGTVDFYISIVEC